MKVWARIAALASAFALVLALGACGGGGSNGGGGEADVVGTWDFTSVVTADGTEYTLSEFAEQNNADVSLLQTTYTFNEDGTISISNMMVGTIGGTWSLSGDQLTVTASYNDQESTAVMTLGKDASGAPTLSMANSDGSTSICTKVS